MQHTEFLWEKKPFPNSLKKNRKKNTGRKYHVYVYKSREKFVNRGKK